MLRKINRILSFLFIFLLPTQLGRHFFPPYAYLSGVRVDYLAPTIYLTDILALVLILLNFKSVLAIFKSKKIIIIYSLFIINLIFSLSPLVSFYRYLKMLEWLGIFAFFYSLTNKQYIVPAFFAATILQVALAIAQVVGGGSLQGVFYFLGERAFSLSTPGIAKASVTGGEILRPYGTFSHPNSLAGFFLLTYFFILFFPVKRFVTKQIMLFPCAFLIFYSFSKSAILTFLLLTAAYYFLSRGSRWCRICVIARIAGLFLFSLIFLMAGTDPLTVDKRLYLVQNALRIFASRPLFGTGLGAYLVAQNKIPSPYTFFFNQPAHNIFLLFLTETGIITTGALLYCWIAGLLKEARKNKAFLFAIAVIAFTGLTDHYWLTLQQNLLVSSVVLALLLNNKKMLDKA